MLVSTKNMYAKMCGQNYVAKIRECSRSVLGRSRPVTPVLFISTIHLSNVSMDEKEAKKNIHLEMRNLKQRELQRL